MFISVGPDESFCAALPPGEYTIGRDPDVEILVDHPTISRRHAKLVVDEGEVALTDLGSGNGTSIEGVLLSGTRHLYEGQTASLGDVKLRIRQTVGLDSLPVGSRNYRKGPRVARGGMGAVHEARQRVMGRKVAMKVMLQENSASGMRRFINEARITGLLEHPNIVPVHELGVDPEGRVFYTMKFVSGTTLAEVLAALKLGNADAVKSYPLAALLTIFQKACDAIAFAHSRGVCHRDIKPDNLMIGDFGEVLVLDWGLAKERGFGGAGGATESGDGAEGQAEGEILDSDGRILRTLEGSVLGTPSYMPPEQARGEIAAVDERSDIYALGAVLHEILYLQPPVSGENTAEILEKVVSGQLDEMPRMARPHLPGGRVPPSLDAVRRKAMAMDPDRRYPRVQELQADVAAYQSGFATSAEGAGVATQALLFFKRNRGVSLAVLAGLVLQIAAFSVYLWDVSAKLVQERKSNEEKTILLNERNAAVAEAQENKKIAEVRADELAKKNVELSRTVEQLEAEKAGRERSERKVTEVTEKSDRQAKEIETANVQKAAKFAETARSKVRVADVDGALKDIDSAIEAHPGNPDYLNFRANLLQSSGQFAEAATAYQVAAEAGAGDASERNRNLSEDFAGGRNPDGKIPPDVLRQMGIVLRDQGRTDELPILNALVAAASSESVQADGRMADKDLQAALGEFKSQAGWKDERLVVQPDGGVRLDLSGLKVGSLDKLYPFNVHALDLRDTQATDLTALRDMPLEELSVAPGTSDLSPLRMDRLLALDLRGSQVSSLEPLTNASELEELWLDGTPVQNLKPLEGKPLKILHADLPGVKDFSVIKSLSSLEELALPKHAAGIPVADLGALKKVRHERFQSEGWIDGKLFQDLSAKSDEAWTRWGSALKALGVDDIGPHRVTVVKENWTASPAPEGTFDLDLRGTEVTDLKALRGVPINRLYLDTRSNPVSLDPLAGHATLQYLVLTGANVPTLGGVLENPKLKSIILSTETADVRRLAGPSFAKKRAGYRMDASTRQPTTTVQELFADRKERERNSLARQRSNNPGPTFTFDDVGIGGDEKEDKKWELSPVPKDGARGLVWRPDSPAEGGQGGGYLEFFERTEDRLTSYFVAPREMFLQRKKLPGSSFGFELRVHGDVVAEQEVDLELKSRTASLRYKFSGRKPTKDWRSFRVVFKEGEGWLRDGNAATMADMEEVLKGLDNVFIRAEYHEGEGYERTSLDNVTLWDPEETRAREEQAMKAELNMDGFLSVETAPVDEWIRRMGVRPYRRSPGDPMRVEEYKGRRYPLLVKAVSAEEPARIKVVPKEKLEARLLLRFAARGAPNVRGVNVKVRQGESVLVEGLVGDSWTEFSVLLPEGVSGKGETLCILEVWPSGDVDPYCLFSGLELVPPSGRN